MLQPANQGNLSHLDILTDREQAVVNLLVDGLGEKQIARHLQLTRAAVHSRFNSIYQKLDLQSRTQVAVFVLTGYRPDAAAKE